jgi:hypothetical protein
VHAALASATSHNSDIVSVGTRHPVDWDPYSGTPPPGGGVNAHSASAARLTMRFEGRRPASPVPDWR